MYVCWSLTRDIWGQMCIWGQVYACQPTPYCAAIQDYNLLEECPYPLPAAYTRYSYMYRMRGDRKPVATHAPRQFLYLRQTLNLRHLHSSLSSSSLSTFVIYLNLCVDCS